MTTIAETAPVKKPVRWTGRVLSGLVIVFLLFDGAIKLVPWPVVTETMDRMGYGSSETARSLGIITIVCTVLYSIRRPRSSAPSCSPAISAARWRPMCGSAAPCSPTRCSGFISA